MDAPRILLVDDEPLVLDALRDRLYRFRKQWQMRFVCGGQAAIERIRSEPFDVVVTDLRMPHVDGFAVLDYTERHSPETIRVVLSGGADDDLPMQIADRAHQSVAKPARPGELESILERAFKIRSLVTESRVRAAIGTIRELSPDRQAYERLAHALGRSQVDTMDVARAIESDVSLTAATLRLVNSTMFGQAEPITSVFQATTRLGLDRIASLLEDGEVASENPARGAIFKAINGHARLVSQVCLRIAPQNSRRDAFTAGLLHDVGWLVIDPPPPVPVDAAGASPETFSGTKDDAERTAAVGAYLLGLWGLPLHVIDAVAHLHHPEGGGDLGHTLRLAHQAVARAIAEQTEPDKIIDTAAALANERCGGNSDH